MSPRLKKLSRKPTDVGWFVALGLISASTKDAVLRSYRARGFRAKAKEVEPGFYEIRYRKW